MGPSRVCFGRKVASNPAQINATGRHLLSTLPALLTGKSASVVAFFWRITERMKTPRCEYVLLPSLLDETLSLEPEEVAEQEDRIRASINDPTLFTEEPHLPVLNGQSNIMHLEEIQKLAPHLPLRVSGHPWNLIYCTAMNGFSLKSMYRSMSDLASPVLLVIRDTDGQMFIHACAAPSSHKPTKREIPLHSTINRIILSEKHSEDPVTPLVPVPKIFGAFSSTPIHVSSCFYGNGETFLFSFAPQLKVFKWTGKNTFFMKGDADALAIGGGSGRFGLWLDGDLNHGGSHPCETFNNEALSLKEEFVIQDLEVWALS